MISEVIMPKLGQTMEEGRVVEWHKAEGEEVARGDLLFTLESDKASLDVEATGRGWLRRILVPADEVVPVLAVVALITSESDEDISAWTPGAVAPEAAAMVTAAAAAVPGIAEPDRAGASPAAETAAGSLQGTTAAPGPAGRIAASPRARRLAAERGIDLARLTGSGPGGRIVEADIPAGPVPDSAVTETIPLTGARGLIAERMTVSARTIPRVTLTTEVDADNLMELRGRLRSREAEWGSAVGYTELVGYLVVQALRDHTALNARLSADGRAIERLAPINLGLAVDTERGLLVPVVADAGSLDLRSFTLRAREVITRAQTGTALPDDLTGGTFTVTNLGAFGIDAFTPMINPPEAAILGLGRIREKPVVFAGRITPRPLMTLSLVFDHRIVDGAPAARFLQRIGELIAHPDEVCAQPPGDTTTGSGPGAGGELSS